MQATEKDALRRFFRTQRETMSAVERRLAEEQITRHVLELSAVRTARTILVYLSCKNEVDTWALLRHFWDNGQVVLAPRCEPGVKGKMNIHRICSLNDIAPGSFAIPEPRPETAPLCPAPNPDLILVPALAFDRHGMRLGFGGGYYDRFLRTLSALPLLIGLAYDFQLVSTLPAEPWDIPVHMIITPQTCIVTEH
ncbi:MAG: 5-formyltetrahydrofolate cyclo-ligase [Desulfovibrionales bacterium]|nr:5-formyltetrahydrofolate cyclo-ligase [Desulfovibrionales bacterium]